MGRATGVSILRRSRMIGLPPAEPFAPALRWPRGSSMDGRTKTPASGIALARRPADKLCAIDANRQKRTLQAPAFHARLPARASDEARSALPRYGSSLLKVMPSLYSRPQALTRLRLHFNCRCVSLPIFTFGCIMSLSTGELTQRTGRPGTDKVTVVERIKQWTRLKLISPIRDLAVRWVTTDTKN